MRFERFSGTALRVMDTASVEAAGAGLELIDVEHILLALLRQKDTVACSVLLRFGLKYKDALPYYAKQDRDEEPQREGAPHLTEKATLAVAVARRLADENGKLVDTEHLLVGVLSEKNWRTRDLLDNFGIDAQLLRSSIGVAIVECFEAPAVQEKVITWTLNGSPSPSIHFDDFSDAAIKIIVAAQDESLQMGHHFVGTEHLLLGLLLDQGVAGKEFLYLDLNIIAVRKEVHKIIGSGSGCKSMEMPFTPRAVRVMSTAKQLASKFNSKTVQPEYLLLALLDDTQNVGSTVLRKMGVNLSRLETKLVKAIQLRKEDL